MRLQSHISGKKGREKKTEHFFWLEGTDRTSPCFIVRKKKKKIRMCFPPLFPFFNRGQPSSLLRAHPTIPINFLRRTGETPLSTGLGRGRHSTTQLGISFGTSPQEQRISGRLRHSPNPLDPGVLQCPLLTVLQLSFPFFESRASPDKCSGQLMTSRWGGVEWGDHRHGRVPQSAAGAFNRESTTLSLCGGEGGGTCDKATDT